MYVWFNNTTYWMLQFIYFVRFTLFSVFGPLCNEIISLFVILSDKFLCKINIFGCNFSLLKGVHEFSETFTTVNNTQHTVWLYLNCRMQCLKDVMIISITIRNNFYVS